MTTPRTPLLSLLAGALVLVGGCVIAQSTNKSPAPDVYALSENAPERLLFSEDFEGESPREFVQWYGGTEPWTLKERTLSEEESLSGKRSFKITVDAPDGGAGYFWIPVKLPLWSQLTVQMHVKAKGAQERSYILGGAWAHPTGAHGGNVFKGARIGALDDGWEKWQLRALPTGDVGDFLQGIAIMASFPKGGGGTYYIDDITVRGRLPADYAERLEDVKRTIDTEIEAKHRALYARRVEDLGARFNKLVARYNSRNAPGNGRSFAATQAATTREHVASEFARITTKISRQVQMYREYEKVDDRETNPLERALGPLEVYVESVLAFGAYAERFARDPFVTYSIEPTQSYQILPTGAQGHQEEHSYYRWSGAGSGIENPQVLPGASPVPGTPSRELAGYGCRGQIVPLSFAVQAGEEMKGLRFEVTDLLGDRETIPADAVDLRVVKAWWRPYGREPQFMNELLLHDDTFVTASPEEPVNRFKETKYPNDSETLTPITIPAGKVRQFYITVRLPDDAPPGTYRGNIKATSASGQDFDLGVTVEVMAFDLEPTPFAYSFYYRSYLADEESKKKEGVHSWYKTADQMRKELINMAEHGCNTLCTYDGHVVKTEDGWDFSKLELVLNMAREAGLTRSPFLWLAHGLYFQPMPERPTAPADMDEVIERMKDKVSAITAFLEEKGFPQAAYYGADERAGEELIRLKPGYQALNDAGGLVAQACYGNYFGEIGTALSLPIVNNSRHDPTTMANMRATQEAGLEVWVYNIPSTNMAASPAVYRRRYGLALWRNDENGAIPWEYSGHPRDLPPYQERPSKTLYTMTHPTWDGRPIDTIIYEAWREGITDTRYMATLEKYLAEAKAKKAAPGLVSRVENWLGTFSVNDDLQQVRRQMADFITELTTALTQ